MRLSWLVACCLVASAAANARPYTIDDMLRVEDYGQVAIDPTGSFAIVERIGRYDSAERYSYGYFVRRLLTKLYRADLRRGGALVPLLEQEADAGYWMGRFSPSGRKLSIFRLHDDKLSAGVIDVETRTVRWLPFTPDLPTASPAPLWLDEHRLLYATVKAGSLPFVLGFGSAIQKRSERLWQRGAEGRQPSHMMIGSGRFGHVGVNDEGQSLLVFDLRKNKARTLFRGEISDFALSADRSQLAVVSKAEAVRYPIDRSLGPSTPWRRQQLSLVNIQTGMSRPVCERCDLLPNLLSWSPVASELLFFARADGEAWENGELFRAKPDGSVEALTGPGLRAVIQRPDDSAYVVKAAWVGPHPIFPAVSGAENDRTDWYTVTTGGTARKLTTNIPSRSMALASVGAEDFYVLADQRLWQVRLDGRARIVPVGSITGLGSGVYDPYGIGIRHFVNDPPKTLHIQGQGARKATMLTQLDAAAQPAGACELPSSLPKVLAADLGSGSAIAYENPTVGTGRLLRLTCDGGAETIDTINEHLASVEATRPIPVSTLSPKGDKLTHWLHLPTPRVEGRPPLVVLPYPGLVFSDTVAPQPNLSAVQGHVHPQILAAKGYAVLQPSIPLAWGTGEPLADLSKIVLPAVDAAQATGKIDGSRVAVYGHSYGGYAALALATQTNRFDAVIDSAGIADLVSGYGDGFDVPHDDLGTSIHPNHAAAWHEGGQGRMGSPPWRDLQRYVRNSPYFQVERIQAPVLLIHGDVDAVPVRQAERMFFALYRSGKDALLVRYAGEAHGFTSPANIRDNWTQIFRFLEETLGATASDRAGKSYNPQ